MQQILTVYDDRQLPEAAVKQITGEKSYGAVIYKRKRLSERAGELSQGPFAVLGKDVGGVLSEAGNISRTAKVLHLFSSAVIEDGQEYSLLRQKVQYVNSCYCVKAGSALAAIVFDSVDEWERLVIETGSAGELKAHASEFKEIKCGAFFDISNKEGFLAYITGGFEARFFNSLDGDEFEVIKRSADKKKIRAEHEFYYLLPERMKSWFVQPYDYREDGEKACYTMERLHAPDLAIRYVHGSIDERGFRQILKLLFRFIGIRQKREVSRDRYFERKQQLYIDKPEKRIADFNSTEVAKSINALMAAGTRYGSVYELFEDYKAVYEKLMAGFQGEFCEVVGHGDLCFSNILYQIDADMIRLIDPKGAEREEELYTDPYYDIAKLSHSVCGNYDFINSALYEIALGEDVTLKLVIDNDNGLYTGIFREFVEKAGFDFKFVRLFECSLFLSMLPLHQDRPNKVMAFALNAINILDEVRNG
ncbi:MAG: hypothetical protein IJU93_07210 [Lachnospiraceae bacterium]|nr:hypothetical protein [Lachnospiraceae bacterium]